MKMILLTAVFAFFTALGAVAQDRPADLVAASVLAAFVERDIPAIQSDSTLVTAASLRPFLNGEADGTAFFNRERNAAATQWDGRILPARYERYLAFVPFAINGPDGAVPLGSGVDGPYNIVLLSLEGTDEPAWRFSQISYFPQSSYDNRAADPF